MNSSRELDALHAAFSFLTRLPLPRREFREGSLADASFYFPLVGVVVGLIGAAVYMLAIPLWGAPLACALTLAAMILATGGFHEDGLADSADGIGGGWSVEDKLRIMKDSRIGTYGALALILALLVKFAALTSIDPAAVPAALIIAHAAGRWTTLPMLKLCDYVGGESGTGKPLVDNFSDNRLWAATAFLLALILVLSPATSMSAVMALAGVLLASRWYLQRKLGGVTGDTLGAVNQLTEIAVYLLFAAGNHATPI